MTEQELRSQGWLSLAECAKGLGFKSWTYVLSWVDAAPAVQVVEISDRSLSKGSRAGLMPDGLTEVRRAIRSIHGRSAGLPMPPQTRKPMPNIARLKQEAADRKAEQERKQAEWRADHQRRRLEAEAARQATAGSHPRCRVEAVGDRTMPDGGSVT